jgi:hypothetical protein
MDPAQRSLGGRGKRATDSTPSESVARAPRMVLVSVNTDERVVRRIASMRDHPSNGIRRRDHLRDAGGGREKDRSEHG